MLVSHIYLFFACSYHIAAGSLLSSHHDTGLDNRHELDYDSGHFYKLVWKGPIDQHLGNLQRPQQKSFQKELKTAHLYDDLVTITSSQNEKYQCVVPRIPSRFDTDPSATNSSSKDEEDEKLNKSPYSLLEKLFKRGYCSVRYEQYWIYELCHGKYLRQYHTIDPTKPIAQEYFLGRFEESELKTHEEKYEKQMEEYRINGSSRPTISIEGHNRPYLMVNMTSGTQCDLTNKSRMSKVFYVCSEEHKHELYSIKETSTCEYEAIVLSPLLCFHDDFKIDSSVEHEIRCFSADNSPVKPKALETIDKEEQKSSTHGKFAFFDGRTLVIDADDIGALITLHSN